MRPLSTGKALENTTKSEKTCSEISEVLSDTNSYNLQEQIYFTEFLLSKSLYEILVLVIYFEFFQIFSKCKERVRR